MRDFNKRLFFIFITLSILSTDFSQLFSQSPIEILEKSKSNNFYDIQKAYNTYWDSIPPNRRRGWKQFKRWEQFWEPRVYPTGEIPPSTKILSEWETYNGKLKTNTTQAASWKLLGPIDNPLAFGSTEKKGLGRVNRIRFSPGDTNTIWAATASGGVWKTTDGGQDWFTFPFTQFLSLGVSDIAISPTNPDIVYAATGDCEPSFSVFYSVGIIKTTDGGNNWQITNLVYSLGSAKNIGRILVNPNNPDIVLAGTKDGIFKTTDGGVTWVNKQGGHYFIDMEFMPTNPNIIYASTYNWGSNFIYKSSDGGETWHSVFSFDKYSYRVALEVTTAASNLVYALVCKTNSTFHSFWASYDSGDNWEEVAVPGSVNNILGRELGTGADTTVGQGYYDLCLAASPKNKDEVFVGGINIWKSPDGGNSFNLSAQWYGGYNKPYVHADQHDLVYVPKSSTIYSANDGGIDKSYDGGNNWVNITDGMSISQFYRISCSETDSTMVIGGSQDNGTRRLQAGDWRHVMDGDGMECAIDPTNAQRVYASIYNGNISRSTNGGTNFYPMIDTSVTHEYGAWTAPFIINPSNPSVLYAGFVNVWELDNYGINPPRKLSNFGGGYYNALEYLAIAPSDQNYIYAATPNNLNYTSDGGKTWNMNLYASAVISGIAVDNNDPKHIWVTKSGFNSGDKVYEYNGNKWNNISGNLPNVPVNCIIEQNNSPDRIYIGTDIGVFYTDYGSNYWLPYGTGLPNVVVYDLSIQYPAKKLAAGTFGRGIWETVLLTCNIPAPNVTVNGNLTFCDGDSVVLEAQPGYSSYLWTNGDTNRTEVIKTSGAYSVAVTDTGGCSAKSAIITVTDLPNGKLAITPLGRFPMCKGDTLTLTASLGFISYKWSTGDTLKKITVTKPGIYTLVAISTNGCSRTISLDVEISPVKPVIVQDESVLMVLNPNPSYKYDWFLDSINLLTTLPTITIKKLGKYSVIATDTNGCTSTSDSINVISSVGEKLGLKDFISIHPNPNTGNFILDINSSYVGAVQCNIINVLGERLLDFNLILQGESSSNDVNMNFLPSGIYFININIGGNIYVKKIIKE